MEQQAEQPVEHLDKAERVAREILAKYPGEFVSRRRGLVTVKIDDNGQTVIVWVRNEPITPRALEMFRKMIEGHQYDKLILVKLYEKADLVKFNDLKIFNEIRKNTY